MPEPNSPPRKVDSDRPLRTGEDMGGREPLMPPPDEDADDRGLLPAKADEVRMSER